MTTKEAIRSIAEHDTLIGQLAWNALEAEDYSAFTQYLVDQVNDGAGASMIVAYGYEVVDTILKGDDK